MSNDNPQPFLILGVRIIIYNLMTTLLLNIDLIRFLLN